MASDKHHRPCLPLKPQEKIYEAIFNTIDSIITLVSK